MHSLEVVVEVSENGTEVVLPSESDLASSQRRRAIVAALARAAYLMSMEDDGGARGGKFRVTVTAAVD